MIPETCFRKHSNTLSIKIYHTSPTKFTNVLRPISSFLLKRIVSPPISLCSRIWLSTAHSTRFNNALELKLPFYWNSSCSFFKFGTNVSSYSKLDKLPFFVTFSWNRDKLESLFQSDFSSSYHVISRGCRVISCFDFVLHHSLHHLFTTFSLS